jgi:protein-S-isoprenylcysteine O-methyltransferase Ste14
MLKIKFLLKGLASTLSFSLILFLSAGKIHYTQGWVYLFTNLLMTILNFLAIQDNAGLISERSKPGEGTKSWDKTILKASGVLILLTIVLAGLDSGRYNWTRDPAWYVYVAGFVLTLTGQLIFVAARRQNTFFSSVARIQTERGHTVCERGLYRVVRHPGYLGMILSLAGIPLLTGSSWSTVPVALAIVLLLIRTDLEDKMLQQELQGYADYTRKTPFRLIPRIW